MINDDLVLLFPLSPPNIKTMRFEMEREEEHKKRVNYSPEPLLFRHIRIEEGWATIAIRGRVAAVAWCSPRDQFSRKRGRAIAGNAVRHRRASSFVFEVPLKNEGESDTCYQRILFQAVIKSLEARIVPTWAVRADWWSLMQQHVEPKNRP